MRVIFLFIVMGVLSLEALSQDNIIFKNGDEIKAKVTEITPTEIKYKKWNQDNPTYSILKRDVFMIIYENGTKEVFKTEEVNNNEIKEENKNEFKYSFAQSSVTLEASLVVSTCKFTDDTGVQDNSFSPIYSGAYGLSYRYASEGGLLIRAGLGIRKAGATMVYDNMNYTWNLQYADVKMGIGYIYNRVRFKPYFSASGYYAMLLKATLSLNNKNFNIKESLQKNDYGVFITPGLQFQASDVISIYTEFNYMLGLQNLETSSGQKLYNQAYSFSLGVAFTF